MSARSWTRIAASTGVLHVAVVLIGVSIHQGSPDVGVSKQGVATFVAGVTSTQTWIGNYVECIGYLFFLVFATYLYRAVSPTAGPWRWLSITALSAAIAYVAVSVGPGIALQEATVQWGKRGVDPQVVAALADVADDVFFLSLTLLALFLGAVAALAWWGHVLPRWLGVGAAVTAVIVLVSSLLANLPGTHGAAMIAFLVFSLWIVITSIALIVRPEVLDTRGEGWRRLRERRSH